MISWWYIYPSILFQILQCIWSPTVSNVITTLNSKQFGKNTLFFSSTDAKGHVCYCHHFASAVVGGGVIVVTFNHIFRSHCQLEPNFVEIFIYCEANFYHIFFFMLLIKYSSCNIPTDFIWLLSFQGCKRVKMGPTS